jgi:hypothetical protein
MKKRLIVFLGFLFVTQNVYSQRVFVTDKREEADKIVFMSKYFSESSLVICRTFNIQDTAKKYHWFFVDSKHNADLVIFYTKRMEDADDIVFYTNRKGLLGSYYAHSKVDPIIPPTRAWLLNQ